MKKFTTETYFQFASKLYDDMVVLMAAKNTDYTAGAGVFANFEASEDFGVDGLVSLNIRMGDKFQRLKSFSKNGKLAVPGEGVEDAYKDIIGYATLALGMLEERKK